MSDEHAFMLQTPLGRTDVRVGAGVRRGLPSIAALLPDARRTVLVVDENVGAAWPDVAVGDLEVVACCDAPAGEAAKDRDVLAALQDVVLELRRSDVVIAIGGGAVLDVAGFAAATARRGVPWVAVATSVVAMADAAIGGKVAVNHERGKNLLGTFHPPRLVLCDVEYLQTLPDRERIAGLAEVYKCGRLGATDVLARLADGPPGDPQTWIAVIHACAALKARVVEADERDLGERRKLNFGHTIGHALERVLGNEALRHGEAVAIGMVAATTLAEQRGWVEGGAASREAEALSRLGLPVSIPADAGADALLDAIREDKKRAGDAHTFILPRGEEIVIASDVTDDEVVASIDAMRATP